ncbi:L-methionine/branched-chain amino acid transporter, partial [Yersinia pestis]
AWQSQVRPQSKLARLSAGQTPVNALTAVVGSCLVFALLIYWLALPLDLLIVYANGIFVLIYLLCMLAGIRLLSGRARVMSVIGSLLCCVLLVMIGWKSVYALLMFALLWMLMSKPKTQLTQP